MTEIERLVSRLNEEYGTKLLSLWVVEYGSAIELKSIAVSKRYRGQGIGRAVIEELKAYAKSINKPIVLIMAAEPSKRSKLLRFYKGLGFRIPGRTKNYEYPNHTHIYIP